MNLEMWRTDHYKPIIDALENHRIPEIYPAEAYIKDEFLDCGLDAGFLAVRDEITKRGGYALVTQAWLNPLAKWIGTRRCLEVMGGCGAVSKGLQDCGVSIRCTDSFSWQKHCPDWFSRPWTQVEMLDATSAIKKYGAESDLIICSWPYLGQDCYDALLEMRNINPLARMIYIGEWRCGSCASPEFFETAVRVEDESFEDAVSGYQTCYLLHDRPYLLR